MKPLIAIALFVIVATIYGQKPTVSIEQYYSPNDVIHVGFDKTIAPGETIIFDVVDPIGNVVQRGASVVYVYADDREIDLTVPKVSDGHYTWRWGKCLSTYQKKTKCYFTALILNR